MPRMIIELEDRLEIERCVAVMVLGFCDALRAKLCSPLVSFDCLMNPLTEQALDEIGADERLIDIIGRGLEFDTIETTVPGAFDEAIEEVQRLTREFLADLPRPRDESFRWIRPRSSSQ